jgi:hypothetical protein
MKSLAGFAVLLVVGCATQSAVTPAIELRVEPAAVQSGDSITLVLRNNSDATVGYNLCASALERRNMDAWQAVPSDHVCTMELRSLPAGQETRYNMVLPANLSAGEYRFVTGVEIMPVGERNGVASQAFRVTA